MSPVRPRPRRRIGRWLVAAALAVGLFLGARAGLRHLAFFSVRRIEVVGAQYLDAATVTAALGLGPRANLFDPIAGLVARVKALPGVMDAGLARRIPGTLRIWVREAEPVALAERGDRLVLVDERGAVLPFDPAQSPADLPVAAADSVVAGLLGRIRDFDPELFGRIQRGSRYRGDVLLDLEEGQLLLRGNAEAGEIEAVAVVAGVLARDGRAWRELDGRYPPRVVVRGNRRA